MFNDDFFGGGIDDLFKKLFNDGSFVETSTVGPDGVKRTTRRMQKDVFGRALLDKVLVKKRVYFIFDYSGQKDVLADVVDELVENDYGERVATGKKVLQIKSNGKTIAQYPLSKEMRKKDFESNFENGILEVSFRR